MKLDDLRCDLPGPAAALRPCDGASPAETELYVRYLRALALLGECAPSIDEPDYADLVGILMRDAEAHYPVRVCRNGGRWEIAPR